MSSADWEDGATVALSADEAVVLFELLSRWIDHSGTGETPGPACFVSSAEAAVLNNLLGALERRLVAPFRGDYMSIVDAARSRLTGQWRYPTLRG